VISDLKSILDARDLRAAIFLLCVILLMSGFEVMGIGAVFWFMKIVLEPGLIAAHAPLVSLQEFLAPKDANQFLIWLGAGLFAVMLTRNAIAALAVYAQERFVLDRNMRLSVRLLRRFMRKPHAEFVTENSADLTKRIINDVWRVSTGIILPIVEIASKLLISTAVILLLLAVDPLLTVSVFAVLGALSALIFIALRKRLHRLGEILLKADSARFMSVSEALGGLKEARVLGREDFFSDRFRDAVRQHRSTLLQHKVLSQLPHFTLESIAVAALLGVILFTLARSGDAAAVVSTATLYAIAGYRILPAVKSIVQGANDIRLSRPFLESLKEDLRRIENRRQHQPVDKEPAFNRDIEFRHLNFSYGAGGGALRDISLIIPKNGSAGFVGPTGAGKSTLIDILLGVLRPGGGGLLIDGIPLDDSNLRSWQDRIGYVPQQIFLTDDTIRRNVAFGVPDAKIDEAAVRRAIRLASLERFVETNLSDGYDTMVGERGVRLSGGERQRIGIARALYHKPDLLVLDEATSALDGRTESVISDAIAALGQEVTLFVIAHRLTTVRDCDRIHLMEDGRIAASGTYDELLQGNRTFQEMARA